MKLNATDVGRIIFAVSQLRFFEKELDAEPENLELQEYVKRWQAQVDKVLYEISALEHIPLRILIDQIKLSNG